MSYAVSGALQAAIYQHLVADSTLTGLVGDNVFDALPAGSRPDLYVTIGPEKVRDWSDKTGRGALHEITISVVSRQAGFAPVKAVAGVVSDALIDAPLTLARGRLIGLRFVKATAARVANADTRRIDLTFRARVSDD